MAVAIEAADELAAVVGLPDQVAERNAAALKMLLYAGGKDSAGSGGTALSESPKQQAAAYVAGGVLDGGQSEGLSLGPVVGNIVEIFGIGGDLLKDTPSGLDVGEVLFALVFAPALVQQTVLAPDAFQGAMAEREIELANEAARAESGQLPA